MSPHGYKYGAPKELYGVGHRGQWGRVLRNLIQKAPQSSEYLDQWAPMGVGMGPPWEFIDWNQEGPWGDALCKLIQKPAKAEHRWAYRPPWV